MPLEEIGFGGLAALEVDEKIPVNQALDATNCYVDDNSVRGRNGYRAVTSGAIGSGAVQGLWRYRPNGTSARTIAVRGGTVYAVTDPTAETASDGSASNLGAPFGSTARIAGAQLGKYLYLASDESGAVWRRVNPAFTLESITALPKPDVPAVATSGTLAVTLFSSLGAPTTTGGAVVASSGVTDWTNISGSVGGKVVYDLGSDHDWSATRWLFVACSPETTSGGGGTFAVEVMTASGNPETLAVIGDTPGDGSPYAAYLSLQGLTSATRAAVRKIQFRQVGPTSTDPFSVSSFLALPSPPAPGEADYYVTYYNSVTGQESVQSDKVVVIYSSDGIDFPQFHAARWVYNNIADQGTKSTDPDAFPADALWNKGANVSTPSSSDFALTRSFSGSIPPGAQFPNADTVRLWRLTSAGIRLVSASCCATRADGSAWTTAGSTNSASDLPAGATTWTSGGTHWEVTDNFGDATLSHQLYKAGGPPPPCVAMTAVNGRLVAGGDPANPNRVAIGSYLPFGKDTDPFPQFPQIPLIPADGWSFDISPTSSEAILALVSGDRSLYILTNEAAYLLTDLDAPLSGTPPIYKVFERGTISRRGAVWAEDALYFCAHDGIYMTRARASAEELTQPIRRLFRSWFQPDSTVVLAYQDRKLYAIRGTNVLRFDFVTGTWTRHTLAHTMLHGDDWRDPTGIYQQMWLLDSGGSVYRWQPGLSPSDTNRAPTDAGTTIPAWTYSTGFSLRGGFSPAGGAGEMKTRLRSVFVDAAGGTVTVNAYKDATSSPTVSKTFQAGEHQLPFAPSVTAYKWRLALTSATNAVQVRRLLWERPPIAGEGG